MRVTIRDVKVICCAPQKINLVTVKVIFFVDVIG